MFRPEGDNNTFGHFSLCLSIGVEPARASQWFDAGEVNVLAPFPSKTSFEQLITPFAVAESGPGTCDGNISNQWRSLDLVERLDCGCGHCLDGERTSTAHT